MVDLQVSDETYSVPLTVRGFAFDDLSNVACPDLRAKLLACAAGAGSNSGYLDLSLYLDPDDALTDAQLALYPDTSTWPDVSADLRRAAKDAGDMGLRMYHGGVQGRYFIDLRDNSQPILFRRGSGFEGPDVARIQMSYYTDGLGVLRDFIPSTGLIFVVDVNSPRRNIPKIALQGSTTTRRLQIAGVGLVSRAGEINVTTYNSGATPATRVTNVPPTHAPVVVTDHRHDAAGNPAASAKAGNVTLEAHFVGLRQWAYIGDPLLAEEPWCGLTASGLQTGISFTNVRLTGSTCERALGVARSTAGGLNAFVQSIPPYHTGISQPNSAGLTNYAWLKYFQQFGRAVDMWHRAVGFLVTVSARGFRYGVHCQAGAGDGPVGQDTGKYNQGVFDIGGERIITALHLEPNAYGHLVKTYINGHFMDEMNLKGENGSVIEILTDGQLAGAVDKASIAADIIIQGNDYAIDNKGNTTDSIANLSVWSCLTAGTCTLVPVRTGTGSSNYNPTTRIFTDPGSSLVWIYRNGGFKPVGDQRFAVMEYEGMLQEASGRVFLGNVNDGHLEHNLDGLKFSNWSQAKLSHDKAAIYNPSPTTVLAHTNSRIQASGNSKRVYDVANVQNLVLGTNRYYGQVIPVDGDGVPTTVPPAAIGGNFLPSFWEGKNCIAFSSGVATGDDDGDDDNA